MVTKIRKHLSYANVMSTIAVFVVLGGGAYAASKLPKNSVGSSQIKDNAVSSSEVKDGSLLSKDFKAGQLPKGAKGDPGAQGASGAQGPQGPKGETGATGPSTGAAGGDLTGNYPNPTIADGSVTTSKLAHAPFLYNTGATQTSIVHDSAFHRLDFATTPQHDGGINSVTSPGKITVSEPGRYLVTGFARWQATNATGSFRQLIVQRAGGPSGSLNIANDVTDPAAALVQPFQGLMTLQPGDEIQALAAHDANADLLVAIELSLVRISG